MTPSQTIQKTAAQPAPRVAVSATFTADSMAETLSFWMRRLGLDLPVQFAPYNQVFQQLLDPASLLSQNRGGVNVVLVRFEDWVRFHNGAQPSLGTLEETARYLVSCLKLAAESAASPILVSVSPCSPGFLATPAAAALNLRMTASLESSLRGVGTVYFVSPAELDALYPVRAPHDPHGDELGHIPYTPEYFTALATLLSRKIQALVSTPYKVVALDCDDTLWRGICGEDGPEGVVVDPARRALQEFMLAQQQAGMLLCLCSKNNDEDVLETFHVHEDMPLRLEHFVARRINWAPKSANLSALAGELQLGLDSFVFVDDNPQECAEVLSGRPEVLTLPLPERDDEIPDFLKHVWAFDRLRVTAEDKRRTELYAQRVERSRLERQAKTLGEFIAALKMEVGIAPVSPDELPRAAQLTQRTNQMNLTTVRKTEADIRGLLTSGAAECLAVKVADRFGDYGFTGLAIVSSRGETLHVDTFLLSCRVLGRGVEHRLLARLGELALAKKLSLLEVPFHPTQRNRPALLFLESVGAQYKEPFEQGFVFRFPAGFAAAVAYKPSGAIPKPAPEPAGPLAPAREPVDFAQIANRLRTVSQIQERVRAESRNGAVRVAPTAAPRTELEQQLAAIWAELLGLPSAGIDDNFFDLGGHSLLAVQLLSRIRQTYAVDLSLDVVYTSAFTIAELAKVIELQLIEKAGAGEYAGILREIEGLSDEEVRALLAAEAETSPRDGGR